MRATGDVMRLTVDTVVDTLSVDEVEGRSDLALGGFLGTRRLGIHAIRVQVPAPETTVLHMCGAAT